MDELEKEIEVSKRLAEARQAHVEWTCEVTPIGVVILLEDKSARTMITACNEKGVFVNKYDVDSDDFITYTDLFEKWLLEVPPSHQNPMGGFTLCGDQMTDEI